MYVFQMLRIAVVLLVGVGSAICTSGVSGEERAYRSRSTAVLDLASGDFVAVGNGTHLGKYTELGNVSITGTNFEALDVQGSATLTTANGDELRVAIAGTMNFFTGTITGAITFEGASSGRFEDATGSALLLAQLQEDFTITVVVAGGIDY